MSIDNKEIHLLLHGMLFDLIEIPHRTFMMGSPQNEYGRRDDELLHSVTLTKKFWIAKNPVSVEQYNCIAGTAYKDDKKPFFWQNPRQKRCTVNWYDAQKFCDILNDRYADFLPSGYMFALPTEAQWECACRASTDTTKMENILKELYDMLKYYIQEEEKLCRLPYVVADALFSARLEPIIELAYRRFDELRWSSLLLNYPQWCRDWYEAEYSADPEFLTRNRGTEKVVRGMGTYSCREKCFPPLNNCPRLAKRDKCDPSRNIATFRIAIAPMLELKQ